jgi:diguanylate cyclase (GGDEF)-like protein/PAS domain S-box-containing protein
MSKPKKPRPSPQEKSADIESLTQHLSRLQQQLQGLASSSEGLSPAQAQGLAQELETVTTSLQRLDGSQVGSKAVGEDPSGSETVSQEEGKAHHPEASFQLDCHFVTNAQGLIQLADQSAGQLLAWPSNNIIGQNLLELLTPDDRFVLQQHLRKLEDGEPGLEWEMSLAPLRKNPFAAFITISALRAPDGAVTAVHWLVRNLSAHKRAMASDELTHALGEHILEGLTLPEVLSHVCHHFVQLFAYPLVWVALKELDGDVTLAAQAGAHPSLIEKVKLELSSVDVACVQTVLASQSSHVCRVDDADWDRESYAYRYGFKSNLSVPLCARGQVFGVLTVGAFRPDAFDPFTVSWFEKLAGQVAVSLLLVKEYEHLRVRGAAIASAEHAVFITDPDGRIEWVNDAYTRLTGYGASELIGTIPRFLKSGKSRTAMRQAHRRRNPGKVWRHELVERRKDGRSFMVEQVFTPLRNDQGRITHFVAIHQDITVRKETEAKFVHLAHHDPLTDLPNRTMFFDRLKQALAHARRNGRSVGLIFLDLDRFKSVNDEFGHEIGDALLRTVADRLTHCVRATDTVARLSGDEFTMILQDLERGQDAGHVAQKILDALSQPFEFNGHRMVAHASLGIALYPFDGTTPDLLIAQADRAMYQAKEKGGNCYQFVSEELNAQAFERLMLEKSVHAAWEREEFLLHFQPEVDLKTGQILGMEALIRWQHPDLGLVFPHQFLPLAEEAEFFSSMQEWILRKTCLQSQEWHTLGLSSGPMAVNVSLNHQDPHTLVDMIKTVLQETGFDAKALVVEIPQSMVLADQAPVSLLVQELVTCGITCVLDDVSDGDSLSGQVECIPFRRLKLASSLVCELPGALDVVKTVQQCFAVARKADLPMSAKGVESVAQVTFLREHGCHHVQGYLCSRPLPADEMTMLLRGWCGSEL